jgi:hypothetical protein
VIDRLLGWAFDHGPLRSWGRSWERGADGKMRLVRRYWTYRKWTERLAALHAALRAEGETP